jgi:hypothetical protein
MVRRTILAACASALALLAPAAAHAQEFPDVTLTSMDQVFTWSGKDPNPTGQGYWFPTKATCSADTCDSFVIHVKLPDGSFPKGPKQPVADGFTRVPSATGGAPDMPGDGILVSIRWATEFDQYNLYVEDMSTGETVAQGIDLDSDAQSVLVSQPHNGDYRVTVVPFYTSFDKADAVYRGEVKPYLDATQRYPEKTSLLPQIETAAPSNFHIGDVPFIPSNPTGWRFTPNGTFTSSCYADETAQYGAQRCLRFDNSIRNVGTGPLILRFAWSPDALVNNCKMEQEIISSDATVTDRDAGPCVFHPQHAHFHYQNMGTYQLFPVDSSGLPGVKPVAVSQKVGFCTVDVEYYTFGRPASETRPRSYSFPTCNVPNSYTPEQNGPYGPASPPEYMGISAGWGDVYTWDLPAQYIDITKVPDGTYEIVSRSNPDGAMLTSGRGLETGVTCIRITGDKVTTVREFPSQPNTAPLPSCGDASPAQRVLAAHHKAKKKHKRRVACRSRRRGRTPHRSKPRRHCKHRSRKHAKRH